MKLVYDLTWATGQASYPRLVVEPGERAALLRAVAILERGHTVIEAWNPDHQGDYEDLGDALCTAAPAIRRLVEEGIDL